MTSYLLITQAVVSILLIIFILLQQRGSGLGSAFGGDGGTFYATRRGIQSKIFVATIVLGILFIILAILNLVF